MKRFSLSQQVLGITRPARASECFRFRAAATTTERHATEPHGLRKFDALWSSSWCVRSGTSCCKCIRSVRVTCRYFSVRCWIGGQLCLSSFSLASLLLLPLITCFPPAVRWCFGEDEGFKQPRTIHLCSNETTPEAPSGAESTHPTMTVLRRASCEQLAHAPISSTVYKGACSSSHRQTSDFHSSFRSGMLF